MVIEQLLDATWVTMGLLCATTAHAQNNNTIMVQVNKPGAEVEPTMWGIFFEDINLGADGGIYTELVKNRSFEFYQPLTGWKVTQSKFNEGSVLVMNRAERIQPIHDI